MKLRDVAAMLTLCAPVALAACSSSPKPAPAPAPAPVAAPAPPPAPTATPEQNQADKGLVRQVQTTLKQDHMYRGRIDGAWGPMTARGVTRFQKAHSLPTTGQLDDATLSAMTLQPSSGGAAPAGND